MKKRISAEELLSELGRDAQFLSEKRERDASRKFLEEELSLAESRLVDELRSLGFDVSSVWDLVNSGGGYGSALDVLLMHAAFDYPDRIREGILRALAIPAAVVRWSELLAFYEHDVLRLPPDLNYLPGLVLAEAANDDVIDDVIRLIKEESGGDRRLPLIGALQRSKNPKARMLLNELRDDPLFKMELKKIRRLSRGSNWPRPKV